MRIDMLRFMDIEAELTGEGITTAYAGLGKIRYAAQG